MYCSSCKNLGAVSRELYHGAFEVYKLVVAGRLRDTDCRSCVALAVR